MENFFSFLGGAVVPVLLWLLAERRAAKAEKTLEEMRRRADAPYLVPETSQRFAHLFLQEGGGIKIVSACSSCVLAWANEQVGDDLATGDPVFLVVENLGDAARRVAVELDGKPIRLAREPEIKSAKGLQFLRYEFDVQKRGREQRIVLRFESGSGRPDTHIYRTVHGERVLQRVDPV